jgi:large subunit ribosomal protein L25
MEKVTLAANVRKTINKTSRSATRKAGKVPGIFYSKISDSIPVEVLVNAINPLVFTAQTHLISLQLDNSQSYDCILKDVQFDPVTDKVVHFDLIGLSATDKIELEVPIALVGSAIGVKDGGLLQQSLHKADIECLPSDIPQHIEIDISKLKMGDSIHIGDLKIEGITFRSSKDSVVVSVMAPKAEKVEDALAEKADEPEVITKGKVEKED